MKTAKVLFFLLLLGVFVALSCKKRRTNPVPNIAFDITVNIALPSYNSLMGVGGYAYVAGGSKGIIVYRASIYEFVAFDRHSPTNDATCEKPIEIDSENFLQLNDMCNGATFSLLDGSPISGATVGLRRYITEFDGNSNLRIYN